MVPVIVGADGVEREEVVETPTTEEPVKMLDDETDVEGVEDPTVPMIEAAADPVEESEDVEMILDPLPRMPFFGCEEVTEEEFRAILEEIAANPEE